MPDFERPLAPRGLAAAPAMARWLIATRRVPDLIVSSPARRALQTATLVQAEIEPVARVELLTDPRIYEAGRTGLLDVIRDHVVPLLLLIGHNPGIEQVLTLLLRDASGAALVGDVPTAAMYVLRLNGSAADAPSARLLARMVPRELPPSLLRA